MVAEDVPDVVSVELSVIVFVVVAVVDVGDVVAEDVCVDVFEVVCEVDAVVETLVVVGVIGVDVTELVIVEVCDEVMVLVRVEVIELVADDVRVVVGVVEAVDVAVDVAEVVGVVRSQPWSVPSMNESISALKNPTCCAHVALVWKARKPRAGRSSQNKPDVVPAGATDSRI